MFPTLPVKQPVGGSRHRDLPKLKESVRLKRESQPVQGAGQSHIAVIVKFQKIKIKIKIKTKKELSEKLYATES
jgi:hypothetical protein